jgi:preprotein translocase subunit SecG
MVTLWAVGQAVVVPVVVQTDSGDGGGGGGGGGGGVLELPPPPQEMMEKASAQATATLSKFFIFEPGFLLKISLYPGILGGLPDFTPEKGSYL